MHDNPTPSPWIAFTPDLDGVSVGAGTLTGFYQRIDYTILLSVSATLGAGFAVTGPVALNLPFAAARSYTGVWDGWLLDVGTALYEANFRMQSTTTLDVYASGSAGAYVNYAAISSTVPFTWGSGDRLEINGIYETSVAP